MDERERKYFYPTCISGLLRPKWGSKFNPCGFVRETYADKIRGAANSLLRFSAIWSVLKTLLLVLMAAKKQSPSNLSLRCRYDLEERLDGLTGKEVCRWGRKEGRREG